MLLAVELSSITIIQVCFYGEWGLCKEEEEGMLAASRRNKINEVRLDFHGKDAILVDWRDLWNPPMSIYLLCSPLKWLTEQLGSVGVLHQVVMPSPLRAIGMVIRTMN